MRSSSSTLLTYFSQSPDIFIRRMKMDRQKVSFSTDFLLIETLESPTNRELFAYWRTLAAKAGGIPSRKAFNPAEIRRVLPFILLIEKMAEDFRVRVSGAETDRMLGFSGRGLISKLPPDLRKKWLPIHRRALDTEKPVFCRRPATGAAAGRLDVEAVCLPFRHGADNALRMVMMAFDIRALGSSG